MKYEEKYNKTIESIKRIYDQADSFGKELMEKEFPELRESEDERIRKELIKVFEKKVQHGFEWKDGIPNNAVIAWLEKQGEQKTIIEGTFVNVDEVREDFMQEVYGVLNADSTNDRANQIIDFFDHLPAITIQKPTEIDENSDIVETLRTEYEKGRADAIAEMKSEWSEEDEKQIRQIERIVKDSGASANLQNKISNWLKSIKPNHWKPSEEKKSFAERFARIVRGNLIGIDKDVQQKFEQLYFEVTGNKMYGGYND